MDDLAVPGYQGGSDDLIVQVQVDPAVGHQVLHKVEHVLGEHGRGAGGHGAGDVLGAVDNHTTVLLDHAAFGQLAVAALVDGDIHDAGPRLHGFYHSFGDEDRG